MIFNIKYHVFIYLFIFIQDWLEPFRKDPKKLKFFENDLIAAVKSISPIEAAHKIHLAFQDLSGLLTIADIGEIGADQLTPFFILAIEQTNPVGLYSTSKILNDYISPLFGGKSPIDHAVEYSCVQFLSIIKSFSEC